ncbi:MAG: ATP synthase F0 subunit B [Deltaproteobacteria bacterium]|nr:ATP synthase F0 subunit B [Deltaproteobacteria bacterium]
MYGALALAVAASDDVPLIDIDHTLWIQLGIFLLLLLFLSKVVFGPYLKLREAREKGIEGARGEAKNMQQGAAERVADYVARLLQAKQRGAEGRARLRAEGADREREVLTLARTETTRSVDAARASLQQEATKLRAEMASRVGELAAAVARKLLGRDVQ